MNISLSQNSRSAEIGFKSVEKSITVAAAGIGARTRRVVGARGIGHLVYPSRICQCTDIPNTVDSGQRSGAFTTSIRGDPLRTPDLRNHSRWFFSLRAPAAVSQTRRTVGNIAPLEREDLIFTCDIVFGFTLSIFTPYNCRRSNFPCKVTFLKSLFIFCYFFSLHDYYKHFIYYYIFVMKMISW